MSSTIKKTREEIKKELVNQINNNFSTRIFQATDSAIRILSRSKKPLTISYLILFLAFAIQVPTLILVNIFKEIDQWKALGVIWIGYIELGLLATVLTYWYHKYFTNELINWFIDSILSESDLDNLKDWLEKRYWNIRLAKVYMLLFAVFWCIAFSVASSLYLGRFIGIGLLSGTIVFGLMAGASYGYVAQLVQFTGIIGKYKFELFELAPARSEVIIHLKKILNTLIYLMTGYFLICTLANAFNIWATLIILSLGWTPTILLFVLYQNSLRQIITSSKWNYLKKIQSRMMGLSKLNGNDKEKIESIKLLMDFHEQIRLTPDSALDTRSVLTLLNQLMLPLLGFLLANIDKIINLLN